MPTFEAAWIMLVLAIILGYWAITKNDDVNATTGDENDAAAAGFGPWIRLQRQRALVWLMAKRKNDIASSQNFEFLHPTNASCQDGIADIRRPRALLLIFPSLELRVPAADGQEDSYNNKKYYHDLARRIQQNTSDCLILHVVIVSSCSHNTHPGLLVKASKNVSELIEQSMSEAMYSWEAEKILHNVVYKDDDDDDDDRSKSKAAAAATACSTSNATTVVPLFHDLNTCILVHGAETCKAVGLRQVAGKYNSLIQLDAVVVTDDDDDDDFSSIPGPLLAVLFRENGHTCPLQGTALYQNLFAGKDYMTKKDKNIHDTGQGKIDNHENDDREVKILKLLWRKPVILVKSASDMAHVAQVISDFVLVSLAKSSGGSITLPSLSTTTRTANMKSRMTRLRQEILQTKAALWDDSPFGQLTTRQALEEFVVSVVDQFLTTPLLAGVDNLLQHHHPAQRDLVRVIPEFHSSRMDFVYSKPCLRKWMQYPCDNDDSSSIRQHEQRDHIVQAWPQSANQNAMTVVIASDPSLQQQQPPTLQVFQSSPTLALKLKSPEAILDYFNLLDTCTVDVAHIPQLQEWNRAIFNQVLESRQLVTDAQRERYQREGMPLVFVPDTAQQTGPAFVDSKLILRWETHDYVYDDENDCSNTDVVSSQPSTVMQSEKKSDATRTTTTTAATTSRIQRVTLSSPILHTAVKMMPPQFAAKFGGMFYCKVLTPAQAYEWIVYDSFRAKKAAVAAADATKREKSPGTKAI